MSAWPSSLNPCPFAGQHGPRPLTAPLWDVQGRVTQVCAQCVYERAKEIGDRTKALQTFNPDPEGAMVRE